MTLKKYLLIMGILTLIAWGIFARIIVVINPWESNWLGWLLFYLALFLALSGTAAILGFILRFKMLGKDLVFRTVITAFRQSFLFSLFIIAILIMLNQHLFSWLNLILLIIILAITEYLLVHNYED